MIVSKNKITTCGYFLKRLRDSDFIAIRLYSDYSATDSRSWSVIVDPMGASLIITCYENKDFNGDIMFEFNDGGSRFPKNYSLVTDSMEVVITNMVTRGIQQKDPSNPYIKKVDKVKISHK